MGRRVRVLGPLLLFGAFGVLFGLFLFLVPSCTWALASPSAIVGRHLAGPVPAPLMIHTPEGGVLFIRGLKQIYTALFKNPQKDNLGSTI